MVDNLILCIILCLTLPLAISENRLFIRDDPATTSFRETFDIFSFPRYLSDQSVGISDAVTTTTIHGGTSLGYYFATLYFGTPGQRETLIVDTGSTITTFPCNECGSSCGTSHFSEFFDPAASSTFDVLKCHQPIGNYQCSRCDTCDFTISYSEGSSYRGDYKKDYVSLQAPVRSGKARSLAKGSNVEENNDKTRVFMPFGCTTRETNLFLTQEADGIFGLGVGTNSFQHPPNIVDSLHLSNGSISNAFSICAGQQGGYLAIGGYNRTFHAPAEIPQYVPYDGTFGQYRVQWSGIKFNGKDLGISSGTLNAGKGAYIDSGTTMVYTTSLIANTINGAITEYCNQGGNNCGGNMRTDNCWYHRKEDYPNIKDFYATFGTYTFEFGTGQNVNYEWKPEDYLFRYSEDQDYYCIGVDAVGGTRTILGGTFMKNHDILFDKENRRIGFVRSDCSADYSLASYPPSKGTGVHPGGTAITIEENFIPRILFIGVIIIIIMTLIACCLSTYREKSSTDGPNALELGFSPERKTVIPAEQSSDQGFRLLKHKDDAPTNEEPDEFAV